jgi:hypothetical protein
MSNTGFKETLLRDMADYSCGRSPSPSVRVPKIEFWETEVRMVGKDYKLVIRGRVWGHREIEDGEEFCSAAVMWLDRNGRFFRTAGNIYALGEPNGDPIPLDGADV